MKFTYMNYDCFSGISKVHIRKGEKVFKARVRLQREDEDIASSFAGIEFAEIKARKIMLKDDLKEAKKELKTLTNLYNQLTQLREFADCEHTQACRHIRKMIRLQDKKIQVLKTSIQTLAEYYPEIVETRLKIAREMPELLEKIGSWRQGIQKNAETLDNA